MCCPRLRHGKRTASRSTFTPAGQERHRGFFSHTHRLATCMTTHWVFLTQRWARNSSPAAMKTLH
eukprot:evm.model.scf_2092.2 EVM.evm.TU.scf_2092.2   scf_2092:6051-6684(+)